MPYLTVEDINSLQPLLIHDMMFQHFIIIAYNIGEVKEDVVAPMTHDKVVYSLFVKAGLEGGNCVRMNNIKY